MLQIGQHRLSTTCIIFSGPTNPLLHVACCEATQHNTTGQTPGSVASACWRLIRLLEYLDGARWTAVSPTYKHLLQSPRLLKGAHSHQKAGVCSKGDWAAGQGLAQEAGHLADLSACFTTHTTAEIWRGGNKRGPSSQPALLATRPRKTENLPLRSHVVDVASRYKEAEPLTSKIAAEVAHGFARIYKRSPLRWPKLRQSAAREAQGLIPADILKYIKHSNACRRRHGALWTLCRSSEYASPPPV